MEGIGRDLATRPMAPCAEGSNPLTGLWPTLLLAAPLAPPCGSYRTTRFVYSLYRATVNAAFEGLLPHPGE
jgi:hypothetical protein